MQKIWNDLSFISGDSFNQNNDRFTAKDLASNDQRVTKYSEQQWLSAVTDGKRYVEDDVDKLKQRCQTYNKNCWSI